MLYFRVEDYELDLWGVGRGKGEHFIYQIWLILFFLSVRRFNLPDTPLL